MTTSSPSRPWRRRFGELLLAASFAIAPATERAADLLHRPAAVLVVGLPTRWLFEERRKRDAG